MAATVSKPLPAPTGSPLSHRFRWIALLFVLLSLPAPIYLSLLAHRFAVDVPYYDEWGLAGMVERYRDGRFPLEHWVAPHSVHRLLFPRIILVTLAHLTGWNVRYEIAVNVLFAWVLLGVVAAQIVFTARKVGSPAYLATMPAVSLVVFSMAQYENWLWGWQNQIFLAAYCIFASLFLLCSAQPSAWRFAGAALLGFVSTYSFANGLLVWPLGLIPLWIGGGYTGKRRNLYVGLWALISACVIFSYLYKLTLPPRVEQADAGWSNASNVVQYYVAYIGSAFASMKLDRALAIGSAGLCAAAVALTFAVLKRRDRVQVWLPAAMMILFGLASGILIVAGRADHGVQQALSSRYITISNSFWIGLLLLVVGLALDRGSLATQLPRRGARLFAGGAVFLVAGLELYANRAGFEAMRQFSHQQRVLRYQLLQGDRSSQMQLLFPDVKWLHWHKEVARRNHLWAWRPGAPPEIFEPPPPSYEDL